MRKRIEKMSGFKRKAPVTADLSAFFYSGVIPRQEIYSGTKTDQIQRKHIRFCLKPVLRTYPAPQV